MPEYLTDRANPDKKLTRAALELDAKASHAMLHAVITGLGGEVRLDGKLLADALMDDLRISFERVEGGYVLRAETREERRETNA